MAWNQGEKAITLQTSSDMRNRQWSIAELSTSAPNVCDFASAGRGYGVVINKPNAGEAASVVREGEVRVQAGSGGLAIGDVVTSAASGYATKVMSGAAGPIRVLGLARSSAASGSFATLDMTHRYTIPASSNVSVGGVV